VLNQVYASVMGKPILVPKGDVTSLGSAIFAFLAAGDVQDHRRGAGRAVPRVYHHRAGAGGRRDVCGTVPAVPQAVFCLRRAPVAAAEIGEILPGLRRIAARRAEARVLEALRAEVYEANLELVRRGLVLYTFGNASGVSREHGLVAIKPSGVPYEKMTPADMVITDLQGRIVEGNPAPVFRPGDARGALPRVPFDWRRGAHALAPRHRLGAGLPRDPLLRHHACGLLPRPGAGDGSAHPAEIESEYEANTGVAIIRTDGRGSIRSAAPPRW
jgi:hypothetical protein